MTGKRESAKQSGETRDKRGFNWGPLFKSLSQFQLQLWFGSTLLFSHFPQTTTTGWKNPGVEKLKYVNIAKRESE